MIDIRLSKIKTNEKKSRRTTRLTGRYYVTDLMHYQRKQILIC